MDSCFRWNDGYERPPRLRLFPLFIKKGSITSSLQCKPESTFPSFGIKPSGFLMEFTPYSDTGLE